MSASSVIYCLLITPYIQADVTVSLVVAFMQQFSVQIFKVPNYNEKLRSSVTVQEFFFASFEFSPSEFKRSNASTSTDYIWSRPVHCSRAPRCTDSDCHYHSLTSQLAVGINLTMSFVCLSNKYFQRAEGRIFNFIISVES